MRLKAYSSEELIERLRVDATVIFEAMIRATQHHRRMTKLGRPSRIGTFCIPATLGRLFAQFGDDLPHFRGETEGVSDGAESAI